MVQTYTAAVSICAASLLVGRVLVALAGWRSWCWVEPGLGFAALLATGGAVAWASGSGAAVTGALALVVLAAALGARRLPPPAPGSWRPGIPVAVLLLAATALPFLAAGHWGLLGPAALRPHILWAEWLQGEAPSPPAPSALGPEALATAVAALPGIGLAPAFVGELFALVALGGLTALGAIGHLAPGRRTLGAVMVGLPYLPACLLSSAAARTGAEALFVLTAAIALLRIERREAAGNAPARALVEGETTARRAALAPLALGAGIFFSNSVAGLVWPAAIVARWSLNRPGIRSALRPGSLRRLPPRPGVLPALGVVAVLALLAAVVVPFSVSSVAPAGLAEPVSPAAGLGIWPHSHYALRGAYTVADWAALAIAAVTLVTALLWWLRRREAAVPVAFGVSSVIYLLQPLFPGDYSRAQALAVVAPLAMLVAMRPLLEELAGAATPLRRGRPASRAPATIAFRRCYWALLAALFVGAAVYSTTLALIHAPVAAR